MIWICSECQKEFKTSYTQVKAHLIGLKNTGIRICTKPPNPDGTDGKGFNKEKMANIRIRKNRRMLMLNLWSQAMPLNSKYQQDWEQFHQDLHYLVKSTLLPRGLIWHLLKRALIMLLRA